MQIQISCLQKPTDLDLHCLQRQDISGFSRTRVNTECEIIRNHLDWQKLLFNSGVVLISVAADD